MKFSSGTGFAYVIIVFVLLILVLGRYIAGGFDFSYFFVGGTDFVDTSKTPLPVVVQHGQGYDGQFFFRYALNPFEFSKIAHGVTVDLVPYRMQRIGYPLITWIFSFGGQPFLVPFALVLVNMLSFIGIFFFTQKFIQMVKGLPEHIYLPLFLCGLYMSVARDLAEVMELFFFWAQCTFILSRPL
ncbi:MAG: hypothetical protein IPP71_02110 [Bacteroidetes bacterium]|nr:hypothetical protein [Bacteroidota bacterium]